MLYSPLFSEYEYFLLPSFLDYPTNLNQNVSRLFTLNSNLYLHVTQFIYYNMCLNKQTLRTDTFITM